MTENKTDTHFVCTGECGGVSDKPGTCQAKDCSKHNMLLEKCDCADGTHQKEEETTNAS